MNMDYRCCWQGMEAAVKENQNGKNEIRMMRDELEMNRREFSIYFGIPVRTIEDWEFGRRNPPEYVPRLMRYMMEYQKLLAQNAEHTEETGNADNEINAEMISEKEQNADDSSEDSEEKGNGINGSV